jgi:hypothetical protein
MIYLCLKFNISRCSGPLVIAINDDTWYLSSSRRIVCFAEDYFIVYDLLHHTEFQNRELSAAPLSYVRMAAILK